MSLISEQLVGYYYGLLYGIDPLYDVFVQVQSYQFGLYTYTASFSKFLHQSPEEGLIDPVNGFIVIKGQITTDSSTIANIISTYTLQGIFLNDPSSNPYLNAYLSSSNQIALVQISSNYAIISGQTYSFYAPGANYSTISTWFVFQNSAFTDLSSGQELLYGAPYPYNFECDIINGYDWIQWGSKKASQTLFLIGDLNCPVCDAFYFAIKNNVEAGQLQVKYSPASNFVGSKHTSRGRAWSLYEAKIPFLDRKTKPKNALIYNEEFFDSVYDTNGNELDSNGGLIPIQNPNKCSQKAASKSTKTFIDQGYTSIPTIFWIDKLTSKPFVGTPNSFTTSGFPVFIPEVAQFLLSIISCNPVKVKTVNCSKGC